MACPSGQVPTGGSNPICYTPCTTTQYYNPDSNTCSGCPPNSQSTGGQDTNCVCNAGTFQVKVPGLQLCPLCPSGTANPTPGAGQCTPCPSGKILDNSCVPQPSCSTTQYYVQDSNSCSECPTSHMSSTGGQDTSCLCDPGHFYFSVLGAQFCLPCSVGYGNPTRGGECTPCPSGQSGSGICIPQASCSTSQFYTAQGNSCTSCPQNMSSLGGQATCRFHSNLLDYDNLNEQNPLTQCTSPACECASPYVSNSDGSQCSLPGPSHHARAFALAKSAPTPHALAQAISTRQFRTPRQRQKRQRALLS